MARRLLGTEAETIELLESQHQRVEDRRADLMALMREPNGREFLLHTEIANNNQAEMPLRMLRYYTDIRLAGHKGPIRQYLIYLGSDPLKMADGIDEPELLDYHYHLVDMHQVNCSGPLVQDNPDALVLAVLCDFGGRDAQEVFNYIVRRLSDLTGNDEKRFREYMTMLEILSENRNLKPQVEEAERMLTQIEIERMPSYVIGVERGMERGMARDSAIEKRLIVRQLLTRMDVDSVADLLSLSVDEVTRFAAEDDGGGSGQIGIGSPACAVLFARAHTVETETTRESTW